MQKNYFWQKQTRLQTVYKTHTQDGFTRCRRCTRCPYKFTGHLVVILFGTLFLCLDMSSYKKYSFIDFTHNTAYIVLFLNFHFCKTMYTARKMHYKMWTIYWKMYKMHMNIPCRPCHKACRACTLSVDVL